MTDPPAPEVEPTSTICARLPARPASLERLHAMFDELPEEVGPEERMRWETVVVEIVSNVIEHPVTPDHAVSVEVRLDVHPDRLDALIVDDAEPAAIPLTRAMPGAEAESGRGLALTQLLCDEFTYERRSERNRWRLVCLRGQLTDPAVS